ncbi:MAG TPA: DUF4157 domain-containing protein [Jatrophihabitans sp.]|nr:DUF4157 domain-containing protein [Jatrophihabitans sp.]
MSTVTAPDLFDRIAGLREAAPSGVGLAEPTHAWLAAAFGTDLSAVRIHTDPVAAELAELLGAEACTIGCDIYFAPGTYRPGTTAGRFLLAHEIAHVVQQAAGRVPGTTYLGVPGDDFERAADEIATRIVTGVPLDAADRGIPVTAGRTGLLVQCHDSFEHRALGDLQTDAITTITGNADPGRRTETLQRQLQLLWLWHQDPLSVTEQQVAELCPWIRTLRLQASGLLVTYGELNALPDYIATAGTADTVGADILLPILQFIRQEGYLQFNKLLGRTVTDGFQGAVFTPSQYLPGLLNTLLGSQALDQLTIHLGYQGTDHYSGLLARNACHFAPFAWYRWQSSYLVARDLATRAFQAGDPNLKAQLTHQAWVQSGYAEHFLQDSFAAGHLVNKTLVMQWFIEWAAGQSVVPVADWDIVRRMTTQLQPGLAGRQLYGLTYPGPSNDPQTSEDLPTYLQRLTSTGIQVGGSGDLGTAYQDYLTLLSNLITQSASAAIHDHYNANSLWVASVAHPEPYEVWGDDTLLSGANGTEGAAQTSLTTQLSQASIAGLLSTGSTEITTEQIRRNFPTQVKAGSLLSLEEWNDTQQAFCGQQIFPQLHDIVVRILSPRIANVSKDQDLATRWSTSLPGCGYAVTTPLRVGGRVFAASNGYLYELDPVTGAVRSSLLVTGAVGVGDYETRLASDGSTIFVGVHGYVYGVRLSAPGQVAWTCSLPKAGYTVVEVLAGNGQAYACSNGYLYELDPGAGSVRRTLQLGSSWGTGDYTAQLALDGTGAILVGMHGYAYRVDAGSFGQLWDASLPKAGYVQVSVLARNGQVFAGSNGYAYRLDLASGRVLDSLPVTGPVGVGDYTTTLAGGESALYVAAHGYVYAIADSNWSAVAWTANLAGNRYQPAELLAQDGQLLAGSYGYLYRIDPRSGAVLRSSLLASAVGVGDYRTRLVADPDLGVVHVGTHGYAYQVASITG